VPARAKVLDAEPEERLEMRAKRLVPVLVTLCTVVSSRKANVTRVPLATVRLRGEKAMSFNVTVRAGAAFAAAQASRVVASANPAAERRMRLLTSCLGVVIARSAGRGAARIRTTRALAQRRSVANGRRAIPCASAPGRVCLRQ
jgi:hypothetical protein